MANKNNQSKRKLPEPPKIRILQAPKSEQKTPFSTVLEGLPEKDQVKILKILEQLGIKKNDPMFLALSIMTEAKFLLEPVPKTLEALKEDTKSELRALCNEIQSSHERQQDIYSQIHATAARVNSILNQKLSEIEQFSQRKNNSLSISKQKILLWSLITSALGGLFSGLLIAVLLIATASQ